MRDIELNESFLTALKDKYPKQSMLIAAVEEILQIERESVYRRIKGNVQFSIREMGILAKHLGISIDNLIVDDPTIVTQLDILSPRVEKSMDVLVKRMGSYLDKVIKTANLPDSEMGSLYTQLPIELFLPYENLSKFMYYTWGLYYVGPEKYRNYSTWKIPDNFLNYHSVIMDAYHKFNKILYICEESIVWDLVHYIRYLAAAGLIGSDDIVKLKKDLHLMLNDLEKLVSTGGPPDNTDKIEFYVSQVKVGITYTYLWSKDYWGSFIATTPVVSPICENLNSCQKVMQWIRSLKKVSTLISGSGDKERILFFKEHHGIVDYL